MTYTAAKRKLRLEQIGMFPFVMLGKNLRVSLSFKNQAQRISFFS